jgi:hypothetical protein
MLDTEKAQALFKKLSTSERESEEYGLKQDSRNAEIHPLSRTFQGMALTESAMSEMHQAE